MEQLPLPLKGCFEAQQRPLVALESSVVSICFPPLKVVQCHLWPYRKLWDADTYPVVDILPLCKRHRAQLYECLRDELTLDCALYDPRTRLRLEYVQLEHGEPQYRLYRGEVLLGVASIKRLRGERYKTNVREVRRNLVSFLIGRVGFGLGETRLIPARTPFDAYKYHRRDLLAG